MRTEHVLYGDAEQRVFGFAHPLIGALVAKKWNFSAETCQVILHYRDPIVGAKPELPIEEKSAVVQLADLFAHGARIGSPEGYPDVAPLLKPLALYVGFPEQGLDSAISEILETTRKQFEAERQ
ncbi:MAG: HDOD domain-containing protein [Proteobacteria bacterium]|nr:HDOD domain-containing protein [Pseudomonadota bacterium]